VTFYSISGVDLETLVALAWAAPLLSPHLRTVATPGMDQSNFHKRLLRLQKIGYVDGGMWYRKDAQRLPRRGGRFWGLTPKGAQEVPEDRRPDRPAVVRQSLLDHDLVVSDLLTALLDRGRQAIGGLTLVREVRLDRAQPKPKCDAVVVLRSGPTVDAVPWVSRMAPTGDDRLRGWAVEVDRRTERLPVIREKALAYKRVWNDPAFYERYGRMPVPLWIVPDQDRANQIMQAWHSVWPEGRWYVTTDAALPALRCVEWNVGQQRTVGLLDGWGQA
jgi:hypothetical protein